MSIVNVIWQSSKRMTCSPCGTDVIMCVTDALTVNGSGLVLGQLYQISSGGTDCSGRRLYNHLIQYDNVQLEDPETPLRSCDIDNAFCKGCLVKYIDWKSQHPIIGGYTFTYPTAVPEVGQILTIGTLDEDTLTGTLTLEDP